MQKRVNKKKSLMIHICIIAVGLFMLYPIAWLIASSFKPNHLIFSDLSLWPKEFTLNNYIEGWKGFAGNHFGKFFINSFIVSILAVFGNVISCSLTAFAFARLNFAFKNFWFGVMLVTIMLPLHVTIVPQFVLFRSMDWVNTFLPLIVPKWLGMEPFFIFLMVQFIRGIPRDLDESAKIDGCGPWQTYYKIILPLLTPALITTAIFSFVWTWDDFFSQLLYLNSPKLYTIPLGLRLFMDSAGESAWGPLFAMSVVALIPCLLLFFFLQKYFVKGIATTGIK